MGSNYSDQNDPFGVNRMYEAMRGYSEKIYGDETRAETDSNEQNRDNIPVADAEIIEDANDRSDVPYSASTIGKLLHSIGGKIAGMILILLILFAIALPELMGLISILIDLAIIGSIIWLVCWGVRKVLGGGRCESDDKRE